MFDMFNKIADIASGAKKRRDQEYTEFLNFYRDLVETVPEDIAKMFDTMSVSIMDIDGTTHPNWGIMLTIKDYLWWKAKVFNGLIFTKGPKATKHNMLHHMAMKAEAQGLDTQERKVILDLLDPK